MYFCFSWKEGAAGVGPSPRPSRGRCAGGGLSGAARATLAGVDCLLVPTAPTIYTLAAVEADPIRLNTTLGTYVNFVNLLELAAVAVPAGFRADGLPFGVTLIGPWGQDGRLAGFAERFERATAQRLGATRAR